MSARVILTYNDLFDARQLSLIDEKINKKRKELSLDCEESIGRTLNLFNREPVRIRKIKHNVLLMDK